MGELHPAMIAKVACLLLLAHAALCSAQTKNIPDLATEKGLTNLVKALKAADLVKTLSGDGKFTVFAPNDAAFNALNNLKNKDGTKLLDFVLKTENKAILEK